MYFVNVGAITRVVESNRKSFVEILLRHKKSRRPRSYRSAMFDAKKAVGLAYVITSALVDTGPFPVCIPGRPWCVLGRFEVLDEVI